MGVSDIQTYVTRGDAGIISISKWSSGTTPIKFKGTKERWSAIVLISQNGITQGSVYALSLVNGSLTVEKLLGKTVTFELNASDNTVVELSGINRWSIATIISTHNMTEVT